MPRERALLTGVRWLRGVRARLVVTFVLAAVVVATAGVVAFTVILEHSDRANIDGSLRTTASAETADIQAGVIRTDRTAPRTGRTTERHRYLPGLVAVYDPSGRLVESEPLALPARLAPPDGLSSSTYDGQPFRILRERVHTAQGTWVVVVGQNRTPTEDSSSDARHALYIVVPAGVLLSAIGAWLLAGAALRPVDRMRRDAQRLSETNEPGLITVPPTSDSLNSLARTFNTLLDRLHASLARQRDLVADAGHELRTPLAVLQTELDTAVRPNRTREDLVDSITHARHEVARLAALSDDLLLLAQADGAGPIVRTDLTDVADLVDTTMGAFRDRFDQAGVRLELRRTGPAGPQVAEIDAVAMRRVLDNLLANALRHTPRGGLVQLRTQVTAAAVTFHVDDTGEGFLPDFLPHAFERFARADRSRSRGSAATGSGLGLAIVETLVTAHGGTVRVANRSSGGASVEVSLPLPNRREDSAVDVPDDLPQPPRIEDARPRVTR